MNEKQLQDILLYEIPITQAMGVVVASVSHNKVCLRAPLAPNINHKSTAFGGSLYSLCVLSGWSLLKTRFAEQQLDGHIVIQASQIDYRKPVHHDLESTTVLDDEKDFNRRLAVFNKKGKARFTLRSQIYSASELAVVFDGKYVVHR